MIIEKALSNLHNLYDHKTPSQVLSRKFCEIVKNNAFYKTPPEDCFCTFNSVVMLCKMNKKRYAL